MEYLYLWRFFKSSTTIILKYPKINRTNDRDNTCAHLLRQIELCYSQLTGDLRFDCYLLCLAFNLISI